MLKLEQLEDRVAPSDLSVGTVNYPTIQSAVKAAAPRDTVFVPPGTYREDVIIDKPISLIGVGMPKIIGSGGDGSGTMEAVIDVRPYTKHVLIQGFDVSSPFSRNAHQLGIYVGAMGADTFDALPSSNSSDITIKDCEIHNLSDPSWQISIAALPMKMTGIRLGPGSKNISVVNNYIHDLRNSGIQRYECQGINLDDSFNGIVTDNRIVNIGNTGIMTDDFSTAFIGWNIIEGTGSHVADLPAKEGALDIRENSTAMLVGNVTINCDIGIHVAWHGVAFAYGNQFEGDLQVVLVDGVFARLWLFGP